MQLHPPLFWIKIQMLLIWRGFTNNKHLLLIMVKVGGTAITEVGKGSGGEAMGMADPEMMVETKTH